MQKVIIAIDGYSACGKSTTAKAVAAILGYSYIDSGAMYRAVTLYFHEHYLNPSSPKDVQKALDNVEITFHHNEKFGRSETYLNGLNVENEIRKMYISEKVSEVSAITEIRHAMVAQQQKMGQKRGVVMDGRDIGTMVFSDAEVKVFMTADVVLRAQRRQMELLEKNQMIELDAIIENLRKRDRIDTTRSEGPLRKATDAVLLDTTHLIIDEQVEFVLNLTTEHILTHYK